jgi:translation initiation factor 6 (eIF-6)
MGIFAGIVMTVTGWGQAQANAFYAQVQALATKAGITTKVDGTTLLGVLIALAAAAALMPNMVGRPLNNLLSRFGVRI